MNPRFIGFCSHLGQPKFGVNMAPLLLFSDKSKIYSSVNKNLDYNLRNLYLANSSIKGKRVNLGGDHSMSIATVAHSLNNHSNLKVLWIDAHADINTPEKSKSGNYHGMPLSFLTGLVKKHSFNFIGNTLPFRNLMYIGIRDLDDFEKYILDKYMIKYITTEEFEKNDFYKILEFIGNSPVHISFDVDSIDPSEISCTGTPVLDGLSSKSVYNLFTILRNKNIVNLDVTEFNPFLGNDLVSERNLVKIENIVSRLF